MLARAAWGGADGLLAGDPAQLGRQAVAVLAVMAYSGAVSFGLLKAIGAVAALRATGRHEGLGLDVEQHGEEAYGTAEGAILVLPDSAPRTPSPVRAPAAHRVGPAARSAGGAA